MSKTIIISGQAGSGKTTLVRKIKDRLKINNEVLFMIGNRKVYYYKNNHYYIIGKYDGITFGGLDNIKDKSDMIPCIEHIRHIDKDAIILCEGYIYKKYNWDNKFILYVTLERRIQNILERRDKSKRSTHKDINIEKEINEHNRWVKIINNRVDDGYIKLNNNTEEEREANVNIIINTMKGG